MVGMEHKGIGYTIEAFIAVLTLFIFAVGSIGAPPAQDWDRFQSQVAARDITFTLQKTGNIEGFLERDETGSLATAASTLTQGRLDVSGDIENLPLGEKKIGFHVLESDIHRFDPENAEDLGDRCATNDDLEEIESEEPILRTVNERHSIYLYVADSDPGISGGNSEEDYDSIWVDNGTRCQFSSSEGPYLQEEMFWWGNASDGTSDLYYDAKNITDSGELVMYEAQQPANFRKTLENDVNGMRTETSVDTFNFSVEELETYSTVVFRQDESLSTINTGGREQRLMSYLEDGSALFLVDLQESDLDSGFMSRTGLEWKDLATTSPVSGARFTGDPESRKVENLFLGQTGDPSSVSLEPGGTVVSGNFRLAEAEIGRYRTDLWNATNMSMDTDPDPVTGVAESSCGNYRNGTFEFPTDAGTEELYVWSSELGDCTDAQEIWALSIDMDGNDNIESDEKTFVTGDTLTVNDREYTVKIYPGSGSCSPGECAEFLYAGSAFIETVNARTQFPGQSIGRFARAGYESSYSQEDRKLLSSVIYWLNGRQNSFGQGSGSISTTTVGGIKNTVYMPYRVNMRWDGG